jgi:hypothetical protein
MTFLILLVAFFVAVNSRRRRWHSGWGRGAHHFPPQGGEPWTRQQVSTQRADLESYVDSLETRIAQLEERLDFTERLLTGRKGPVDWRAEAASRELSDRAEESETPGMKGDA